MVGNNPRLLTGYRKVGIIQIMMKHEAKLITYKIKARPDELLYSMSNCPTKEIDGQQFIYVAKTIPTETTVQTTLLMRKDSVQKV